MLKVILFLVAGAVIVSAAWLLAGVPGHVVATLGSFTVDTSAPVAILLFTVLIIVTIAMLRILRGIVGVPRMGARWRRQSRRIRGERTITRVLVALAAGEQGAALKSARRARALLGESPQTLLLLAEASRLSGREDEAEEAFIALTGKKDAQFLGLRGLLRQAVDRRDWSKALVIANQAEVAHPGTAWLRRQRADLALQTENWAEALDLVGDDPRRPIYYVAAADAERDPARALGFAKQAWKQDPSFPPAALAYASRLRALGYEKRAQSCISRSWKLAPHPDLADFALALAPDNLARLQAARRLVKSNPAHVESRVVLAKAELEAGLPGSARTQIEAAQAQGVHQRRICLLMAEIEEQERGDTEAGRLAQRDALRRAATADPDPHWKCTNCQTDHAAWHPKCRSCEHFGTIQWSSTTPSSNVAVVAA